MRLTLFAVTFLVILAASAAAPEAAANKEHQQLMADIRMLQEQSQQLQNLLAALNESLKAVSTRLDQQTETNRKAFADQKLVVDNLSNDVRVIREKLDDNNVRVGSLTQEVEALRQGLQQSTRPPATTNDLADPSATPGAAPASQTPSAPGVGQSPLKMYDSANSDYMAGQYELAIIGFQEFIKAFPKSEMADDAQVAICNAYIQDHKDQQAVDACDLAIRNYPSGNAIPTAYYRKGLALSNLKNVAGAREAWETVVKMFPDSAEAGLARQGLERVKRP
ncbi:MAG TPA: tetratricopeptide repeat protein [Vicinamibacterales bacterium]|jgi:TolA-binding protein